VPADGLRGAAPPGQDVAQEVALVAGLDRGDRELLGDDQRGHRRGPLEDLHILAGQFAVTGHRNDPAMVERPGHDADYRDLHVAVSAQTGPPMQQRGQVRRHLAGGGQHPPAGVGDTHRPAKQPDQLVGDLLQSPAVQHDLEQHMVHLLGPGQ
jgi:hypothetical protein